MRQHIGKCYMQLGVFEKYVDCELFCSSVLFLEENGKHPDSYQSGRFATLKECNFSHLIGIHLNCTESSSYRVRKYIQPILKTKLLRIIKETKKCVFVAWSSFLSCNFIGIITLIR